LVRTSRNLRASYSRVPLLGWLCGALIAVTLERFAGTPVALALGLPKIPVLFGLDIMLKKPILVPNAILYVFFVYGLPMGVTTRSSISLTNRLAGRLIRFPIAITVGAHLALPYTN